MWLETEKEYIIEKFSFLRKYNFEFQFIAFQKNSRPEVKMDTMVAIIFNKNNLLVIKRLRNYPLEPLCFYKLNSKDELLEIFALRTDKEIPVYQRDLELWKKILKSKKFLSHSDSIDIVAKSIKRQIEESKTFYGFIL